MESITSSKETRLFKKSTVCLRCGMGRTWSRKMGYDACSSWGGFWESHLWNKEPFEADVYVCRPNKYSLNQEK